MSIIDDINASGLPADGQVMSAHDLVRLALHAVRDDRGVAADYAGRFRLVMVDGFQDTDSQQLELISLLSGGDAEHLATVGDAQQSIYRFRGADVGVFRARGASLPPEDHIRLSVNYRSHADVLSFVGRVCGGERGVVEDYMRLDPNPSRRDDYVARSLPRVSVELTVGQSRVSTEQRAVAAVAVGATGVQSSSAPMASRIGGRMETGVAPTATIRVPKPMLIIMICTARFSRAMVLMKMMMRRSAPVFSM